MTQPDSAYRVYTSSFASDNTTGVHPAAMEAMITANEGDTIAYGDDPYTEKAVDVFRQHFGADAEPFLVMNGTGANVTALSRQLYAPTAPISMSMNAEHPNGWQDANSCLSVHRTEN